MKLFRAYKLPYVIYNFFQKKSLLHNLPVYKKYGIKKKYYSAVSSEDFKHIESPLNIYDDKDSSVEMPKNPKFKDLEKSIGDSLLSWSKDGYCILNKFFSSQEIDSYNHEVESLIENKTVKFKNGDRIMFAIHHSERLKSAGQNKKLLQALDLLLGKKVELFQSINFIEGSQQRTHSDSIHMTTFPYGNIIAVWVAMEDIGPNCGPLHYYPGSHKLPYVMNVDYGNTGSKYKLGQKTYGDYENYIETLVKKHRLKKEIFQAKKGDVFIWHANLLHGGEKVIDEKSTRKSMVFHYYAKDAICFHEITQRPTLKRFSI